MINNLINIFDFSTMPKRPNETIRNSIDLSTVNPEILEAIFLRFPKDDLVNCRRVCKLWNEIIKARSFWIAKEDFEGENYLRTLVDTGKPLFEGDLALISIRKPFEREFLKNENPKGKTTVAQHADARWKFKNGGNGWIVESPPGFINKFHPEYTPMFDTCLVTSYRICSKEMAFIIDNVGLTHPIVDNYCPPLVFSEWVINRADCGCIYQSSITLYDSQRRVLAEETKELSFAYGDQQKWQKVEVVIKSYPPGVRIIRLYSSGKDLQFWAGHYGPKIAGSSFMIRMENTREAELFENL